MLYAASAAPGIVRLDDDSLEFQLVAPTLGIAHPTGYPVYTLLGWLWSRLLFPIGNWAWRMNLFSSLAGAGAVTLLFMTVRSLVANRSGRPDRAERPALAATGAALAFALGPVWWRQTTVAEVYALHCFFVAAILYAAVSLPNMAVKTHLRLAHFAHPAWLFLWIGLALAHHRTVVLLLPALALYLRWRRTDLWPLRRAWWLWGIALCLPLLLYAYIPIRAAMGVTDLNGDYVNSWSGFWFHVLARGYAGYFRDGWMVAPDTVRQWVPLFRQQVGLPALGLSIAGLVWLGSRQGAARAAGVLILLVFLANLIFALLYRVADGEVFLLPAFLCVALGVGAGIGAVDAFARRTPSLSVGIQLAIVIGLAIRGAGPGVAPVYGWAAHDYAAAMARVPFPPGSRVIGLVGEVVALQYMQQTEGLGLNALPVAADDEDIRRKRIAYSVTAGHPVFLTRELSGIETLYSYSGMGPLVRVWPRGHAQIDSPQYPMTVDLASGSLRALGYDLQTIQQGGGPAAQVAFYWQPQTVLTRTLKLSLRWQDDAGATLTTPAGQPAVADLYPLHQVSPTWAWVPGETVRDAYLLPIPAGRRPAQLLVILYDAETLAEAGRWQIPLPPPDRT